LWNLLRNSAKFSTAGGRVVVRTWNKAYRLLIEGFRWWTWMYTLPN
jgi:signal transduction histidine kinase